MRGRRWRSFASNCLTRGIDPPVAILIDAYNVLHCTHILAAQHALMSVEQLCGLLSRSAWRSGRMVVVCDGARPTLGPVEDEVGDVQLIYAGGGRDADSCIERLIAEDHAPRHLTVVSNDRRLIAAARRRRAKSMSSEDFLRELVRRPRKTPPGKPTPEGDAEAWMAELGLTDADALPPVVERKPEAPAEPPDRGGPSQGEPRRPDESEADYWLREFGLDEDPFADKDR